MNTIIRTTFALLLLTSMIVAGPLLTVAAQQTDGHAGLPGYPARYMGGEAKLATAPNGAVIYDKALEAASQVVYTEC